MPSARFRIVMLAVLLFGGCAGEEPPPEELPVPPVPPARAQAARPATVPPRPAPTEGQAPPAAAAAPEDARAPPAVPSASPWRVARDGTLGCADAAPLRLLRQGADAPPRLLAEARAAGGCRTTFRVNAWGLEGVEGDLVRLRLLNGEALTLWFLRAEVVGP